MLTKAFTLLLFGIGITRLFLHSQWKGLSRWLARCVDLALLVFVVIWAIQLVVMAAR